MTRTQRLAACRAATVLVALATLLMTGSLAGAASAADLPPARWETRHTVCVESHMGSNWSSDNAAVKAIDDATWQWNLVYRNWSCDGYDQVITLHKVNYPDRGRAWTSKVTVFKTDDDGDAFAAFTGVHIYMNVGTGKSYTWSTNKRTWMHELMHGMATPRGNDWSGGHTDRCDSLLTDSYMCLHAYGDDGDPIGAPTDYDKTWIRDVYHEWATFSAM